MEILRAIKGIQAGHSPLLEAALLLSESTERTLYHGTIRDYERSIRRNGLMACVGSRVQDAYGCSLDDEMMEALVFLGDKRGLGQCFGSIIHFIAEKLGKDYHDVTDEEVKRHGLLCKIWWDEVNYPDDYGHHPGHENLGYYDEHPATVEPGDYYSRSDVGVDEFLKGAPMMRVFRRYGVIPRTWGPDERKGLEQRAMKAFKKHGNKSISDIAALEQLRKMDSGQLHDILRRYQMHPVG